MKQFLSISITSCLICCSFILHGQLFDSSWNKLLNYESKNYHFSLHEKIHIYESNHLFTLNNNNQTITGTKSIAFLNNKKERKINRKDRVELFKMLESYFTIQNGKRVYISSDVTLATFTFIEANNNPTYIEVYIPKTKGHFIKIIMIEDQAKYMTELSGFTCEKDSTAKYLNNPSFEGLPTAKKSKETKNNPPKHWIDCGASQFENKSPPDLFSKSERSTTITATPSDGQTFLGMVARDDGSYEALSQKLWSPLLAGNCYSFTIDVMRSDNYKSRCLCCPHANLNFNNLIQLRVFISNDVCGHDKQVLVTKPILYNEWQTIPIHFKCTKDANFITIEAFHVNPSAPLNGNILLDNITNFSACKCIDED